MLTSLADNMLTNLADDLSRTADSIDLIEEHEAITIINAALDMANKVLGAHRAQVYVVRQSDVESYIGDMFSLVTCAPRKPVSGEPDRWMDLYGRRSQYPVKADTERGVWEYVYDENAPIWVTGPNHDKNALPLRKKPNHDKDDKDDKDEKDELALENQIPGKPKLPAMYNYADHNVETVITIPFKTKIEKRNVCWGMLNFDFCDEVKYREEQFAALDRIADHLSSIKWKANAWECTRSDTKRAVERFDQWCRTSEESIVHRHPYFGPPDLAKNRLDLFVLMPFEEELRPVYDDHIGKVASELGLAVKRADAFVSVDSVISDVWNAICSSQAIIADCTRRNANVFYEMGMAHMLGKPVILLTQEPNDIPFDIQHIRFIQYTYTPRGMLDFEQKLKDTIRSVLGLVTP